MAGIKLVTEDNKLIGYVDDDGVIRLTVDSKISEIDSIVVQARVQTPIHQADMGNSTQNHINYTVPTGKILYITTLTVVYSSTSGGDIYVEWQEDGTGFHPMFVADGANSYCHAIFTDGNPLGGFSAGTVIRARREAGQSGRDWSASFTGYLEDV